MVDESQLESLFAAALETPPEQRAAFLDQECRGDAGLRDRVERLLESFYRAGSFLERSPPGLAATTGADAEDMVDAADSDVALDFLAPSDKSGCLGTLGMYEVVEVIGRGGMGIVMRAIDPKLNRVVALKVLSPVLASDPLAVKRFFREAQAAAAVSHPHIVAIHAIEEQQRVPFLVMEYVHGKSLQQKIDESGPLGVKEILRIGIQAARGLAAAHQQGLVHRDIKLANILLENGVERVKLTDFGLARAADDVGVTRTGQIAGTPEFMSPEQALGQQLDWRSDLFSLGSVLYAMCTGRPPFRANSTVAMLRRVCDESPRSIRQINSEIPQWLEAATFRLLAKNPADRFQSADAVADLLSQQLAKLQFSPDIPEVEPVAASPIRVPLVAPWPAESWGQPPPKPAAQRNAIARPPFPAALLVAGATGLLLLALASAAAVFLIKSKFDRARVDVHDPNALVTRDADDTIEITKRSGTVQVRPGANSLHGSDENQELQTDQFSAGQNRGLSVRVTSEHRNDTAQRSERIASAGPIIAEVDEAVVNGILEINTADHLFGGTDVWGFSAAISPDGRQALVGHDRTGVSLWDLATGGLLKKFQGPELAVRRVHFLREGLITACSEDGTIRVWNQETGMEIRRFAGHTGRVDCIALSPDRSLLVSGAADYGRNRDQSVRLWNVANGEQVRELPTELPYVRDLVFSQDGASVYGIGVGLTSVIQWDVTSGNAIHRFPSSPTAPISLAVSPDGTLLATGHTAARQDGVEWNDPASCVVRIWDLKSRTIIGELHGHHGPVGQVCFTPDGRHLLTAATGEHAANNEFYPSSDDTVRLWDFRAGRELVRFHTQERLIQLAVAPDSRFFLTIGDSFRKWTIPRTNSSRP